MERALLKPTCGASERKSINPARFENCSVIAETLPSGHLRCVTTILWAPIQERPTFTTFGLPLKSHGIC
jgi:hypothetical protein